MPFLFDGRIILCAVPITSFAMRVLRPLLRAIITDGAPKMITFGFKDCAFDEIMERDWGVGDNVMG